MSTIRAKPYYIAMSTEEWNQLSSYEQQRHVATTPKKTPAVPPSGPQQPTITDPKAIRTLKQVAQVKEHTHALQQLWLLLEIDAAAPSPLQFALWRRYDYETISDAFEATAIMLSKLRTSDKPEEANKAHDAKIRYASGCMVRMTKAIYKLSTFKTFEDGTGLPDDWETLDSHEKRTLIRMHRVDRDE